MYVIFVIFSLIASAPDYVDVGAGKSNKTFDTLEACQAALPALVDKANTELADQGVKIRTAECMTPDDADKKAAELQQNEPK